MMRSNLYLCALSIAALVVGKDVPNPQVRATRVEEATPASLITPAPLLHGDIFKRSIATCGFIRGNSGTSNFTFAERSTSNLEQHYLLHVQRITTALLQNALGPSLSSALHAAITSSVSTIGPHAGRMVRPTAWAMHSQTTPARPYWVRFFNGMYSKSFAIEPVLIADYSSRESQRCVRYARSSALGATNTYYSWACGTTSDDILMLATVTNGAFQTPHSDPTGIEELLRSFTDASLPTAASNNPPVGGGGGGSSNPISNTAIALISVAGIGVIAIALLIGYFCWWRRRYNENTGIVQQTKPSHLPYEPTVTQGPPTEYIPSWSGGIPLGASPNQPPSEPARSEYSGPTANGRFWPMSTVHEQGSSAGHRFY
jgi:hypothetical protein